MNLEPLNIFLYTWRFLATLEREEKHFLVRKAFHWSSIITGWTVPLLYYCIIVALVVTQTYYETNLINGDVDEAAFWDDIVNGLHKFLGYLITFTNCLSCFITVLVIRFARKLTQPVVPAFGNI